MKRMWNIFEALALISLAVGLGSFIVELLGESKITTIIVVLTAVGFGILAASKIFEAIFGEGK